MMATYPGMTLGGEVRESISLDEDDLSDVEDEVFIRDGKNGYKLAEELNVKRPLMAPRRKIGKPDITTRLKNKPPCRALCKPCCYVFAALSVLIGLIVLVVILVSMFPLPLDKLRVWIMSKNPELTFKLLPCNDLNVTEIWSINLPKLTTDSPVRTLDVNNDGAEDLIFGFGTGDNYDILPPDIFCPMFMNVQAPCEGGVVALNGLNGEILWQQWTNDTIFSLQCTEDVNNDGLEDCLVIGDEGTITMLNPKNGEKIWKLNTGKLNIFVGSFIPDQNHDNVSDVLASHSTLDNDVGHLILLSGKTGEELKRISTPNEAKTFYMPQLLRVNKTSLYIIIGTGSPNTPGNLTVVPLQDLVLGNLTNKIDIYEDTFKGILTQSVLVDITGDRIPDIITAMYNSTVVAINGKNFSQIWNYTIQGPYSESNFVPTPGYFNSDNVTDFLVIYEKYDKILNYNFTQAFIIDGKTGEPIYKPISGGVNTQMNGLTLSMESYGNDMYLFWTTDCAKNEIVRKTSNDKDNYNTFYEYCRQQFNSTSVMKLNVLNQYHQPPGVIIYNSDNHVSLEFNDTTSIIKQMREYLQKHPKPVEHGQSEVNENYEVDPVSINIRKYGSSSFRHKDNRNGIVKDYMRNNNDGLVGEPEMPKYEPDYPYQPNEPIMNDFPPEEIIEDYHVDDGINPNIYDEESKPTNRDPRSKDKKSSITETDPTNTKPNENKTRKKNLPDPKYGIYDYKNIKMARNRLLHDVSNLPIDILKDTYFKSEEERLRKSKFEQRDISSHNDKMKDDEDVLKIIEDEKKNMPNVSLNLWDLETEHELRDRENGYWRGKREVNYTFDGVRKITSVGSVINTINNTKNSIDIVFITYWQPTTNAVKREIEEELQKCLQEKLKSTEGEAGGPQKLSPNERKSLRRQCIVEQTNSFEYFNKINQLKLGQMTVYRLRIECMCDAVNNNERCAKFLPTNKQSWPSYLGNLGDGYFKGRM